MFAAAENLQFETAARLRDDIKRLQQGEKVDVSPDSNKKPAKTRARAAKSPRTANTRRRR